MVRRIAAALFCAAILPALPAEPKKVVLVLSGGGARGLAHIGVLEVLREMRVPVHLIVSTSMGSIVGGAYAAGHTPGEMRLLLEQADWETMFSDRPPRSDLSFRRKADDMRLVGKSELGVKGDGVVLPRGAFGVQNLEEFLRTVARPTSDRRNLDQLAIPMRAVATDLESGELVVLRNVSLAVAMRASMSIPGAFAPTQVEGRLLGDGGLVRNLPVEVAREMGADVVIAVNVGTPLLPRTALSSALGVAQQMINILTEQNVGISMAALRPGDILISPDLRDVTFVDFDRGPDVIERGVAAARLVAERLRPLALEPHEYALWESRRTRRTEFAELPVDAVVVQGAARTNPVALVREAERAGVVEGREASDKELQQAARTIYGMGEFERVDVRNAYEEGLRQVVIEVDEKPWGPDYIRFGGRAVSDVNTDGRFSLTVQHTQTWINSWGAEWRNEIEVGDTRRFLTSLYQPLGPGSAWFVEPFFVTAQSDFDVYGAGNRRTDRVTTGLTGAAVNLGVRLGPSGVARLGFGQERYRSTPAISSRLEGTVRDRGNFVRAGFSFDTLDDAHFPRKGSFIVGEATAIDYTSDTGKPVQTLRFEGLLPVTFGRLTLLGIGRAAYSRDDRGGFGLGGFLNLSGTPQNSIVGSQMGAVAGLAYYRMGELPRALGRSWYAGISLEAGNAWQKRSDMSFGNLRKAGSFYLGLDSIIGPLYLGWGHTFGGDSAVYLFLGRPGDRN